MPFSHFPSFSRPGINNFKIPWLSIRVRTLPIYLPTITANIKKTKDTDVREDVERLSVENDVRSALDAVDVTRQNVLSVLGCDLTFDVEHFLSEGELERAIRFIRHQDVHIWGKNSRRLQEIRKGRGNDVAANGDVVFHLPLSPSLKETLRTWTPFTLAPKAKENGEKDSGSKHKILTLMTNNYFMTYMYCYLYLFNFNIYYIYIVLFIFNIFFH